MLKKHSRGYTLVEALIAAGVFAVLSIWASSLLLYAARTSSSFLVRRELLENARIILDFLTTNIQTAEEITIESHPDGTLEKLVLIEPDSSGALHEYVFEYDSSLTKDNPRYHRVEFGGNELASFINDLRVNVVDDLLTVSLVTDDGLGSSAKAEKLVLESTVWVKYKTVKIK